MDGANVRENHIAEPGGAKAPDPAAEAVMRRWAARRAQVEREQAAARLLRRADAALRLQLLAQLGSLLDALQRQRAAWSTHGRAA